MKAGNKVQQGILSLLFLLSTCNHLQAALISGVIKNAKPGAPVQVSVPHQYIDGRNLNFRAVLDEQLRFSIPVEVHEPGLVFFMFDNDRLPVFLADEDTLSIKTDAFQFPVVASFGGPRSADNRLLQAYLKQNQLDFNEFNNIRFKIGQSWIIVEDQVNSRMEHLAPDLFRSAMDAQRDASLKLVDEFIIQSQEEFSPVFLDWINTEITYCWAYHLLAYGQVYAGRYNIQPDFFGFLYDAPITQDMIGSAWYRQFILAFIARQQVKTGQTDNFWAGQFNLAEKLLSGKSLAFFRSEIIANAFSTEHFSEILPSYRYFLEHNPFKMFDAKVEDLYQKYARVSPGIPAPAFEAQDRAGNLVSLAAFKGKIIYLNFWASWCGSCLQKMELFDQFETELNARGIEIVNVSVDERPASWEAALNRRPYKGHHLLASSGTGQNIARAYNVEAVPQYFIIGKSGLFEAKAASSQPNDVRQKLLDLSEKSR